MLFNTLFDRHNYNGLIVGVVRYPKTGYGSTYTSRPSASSLANMAKRPHPGGKHQETDFHVLHLTILKGLDYYV